MATADCSLIYPCGIDTGCTFPGPAVAEVHRVFTAITARLLDAFGHGPAGRKHPAIDNLVQLRVPGATPAPATPYMPTALVSETALPSHTPQVHLP